MPKGSDTTEGPDADPGEDQVGGAAHADIIERLLEYQRLLRKETGWEIATFGAPRTTRCRRASRFSDEPSPRPDMGSELEPPAERDPEHRGAEATSSEASDARQLKDRLDRLDETVARISAMRPLLKGGEGWPFRILTTPRARRIHSGPGAVAQSVRAADS